MNIISHVTLKSQLPFELQNYVYVESPIITVFMIPIIIAYFIGSIGLFRLKSWGGIFYLVAIITGIFFSSFGAPKIEHAFTSSLGEISSLVMGFIIALFFFTDAIKKVETDKKE